MRSMFLVLCMAQHVPESLDFLKAVREANEDDENVRHSPIQRADNGLEEDREKRPQLCAMLPGLDDLKLIALAPGPHGRFGDLANQCVVVTLTKRSAQPQRPPGMHRWRVVAHRRRTKSIGPVMRERRR